ncbi:MAG: ribokinase, partial [Planctomycetota bacterium]
MSDTSTPKIVMVGSSNVDLIAYVPKFPAPGETLHGSDFKTGCGGKGANQAVMAARLGAQVHAVTVLGDDVFGPSTKQNYIDQGIDPKHIHIAEGVASGVAPITVDTTTGQNSIVIVPAANNLLDPQKVQAARGEIEAADCVICQLETPIPATVEAFKIARVAGTTTILNPAPAGEIPAELLRLTDIFVPNETEAAELTGMSVESNDEA